MADNTQLADGQKWLYLYDANDTAHPYIGKIAVDKDQAPVTGQTEKAPVNETSAFFNAQTSEWVDGVVIVYGINADNTLGNLARRPKGYTLADHETFVKPEDGLYEPTWNGTTWVGITAEEYYAKHPVEPAKPSATQELLMNQTANITQLRKTVMDQQSTITQLQQLAMKQQATLTTIQKGDTNNG